MPSLPTPGLSKNRWGDDLNDFLRVAHNEDGTLKDVATDADLTALTAETARVKARVIDVMDYATGDGTTDDAAAILSAHNDLMTAGGGELFFGTPPVAYRIASNITQLVTAPLTMNLNGQTILRTPTSTWGIRPPTVTPTKTLASPVAYGDQTITLTSATGVLPGDIFEVSESVDMGGANARQTYCARSVSGNVITLTTSSRMIFTTAATITHYYSPHRFTMRDGVLHFASEPTFSQTMVTLGGFNQPQVDNIMLSSDQAWKDGLPNGFGISMSGLVAPSFTNIKCDSIAYGIQGGGISVSVTNITARNTRHPTVPSNWCNGFSVVGVRTTDCYQTIDSHHAFDVHYSDVIATRDAGIPNLRTIGGGISNALVYADADDTWEGPHFQFYTLTHPTWYDDAVLSLRDVRIESPNRTLSAVGCTFGHVVMDNVVAKCGPTSSNPPFSNDLKSIRLSESCRNPDGTPWTRKTVRLDTRVTASPNLPAYLDTGVYHINPFLTLTDHKSGMMKAYGSVFTNLSTDPIAISIRVHTNVFGTGDYPPVVFGQITLKAGLRHSNSGRFDIKAQTYDFYQKCAATSTIDLPTTPSFVSAATGQTNESITMTLSNVTGAGFTELGGTYPDTYFQFDLAISSGRTSPRYTLWYEIDLIRTASS